MVAAWGATPVVTEGPASTGAVAAVATRSGLPEDQLVAVSLESLVAARPVGVLGTGAFRRCATTPSTQRAVDTELARAEAARAAGDLAEAWTLLDLVVVHLGCLTEVASAATASRAFALRAQVRSARGDTEGIAEEEAAAAAFSAGAGGPATVSTVGAGASGPWLDGRTLAPGGGVAPGLHLLQYAEAGGVRSGWLTVGGPVVVVFPGGLARPVLPGLADPARRPAVESVLRAVVDAPVAYVTADGGMWLVELADPPRTTELTPPASGRPPDAPDAKRKKHP